MKKVKLFALALMAMFSLSAMADVKTYTFDDNVALDTDWEVVTNVPSGGQAKCEISQNIGGSFAVKDNNYLGLAYLNKSGIGIDVTTTASYDEISEVSLDVVASDNSKPSFAIYIVTEDGDEEILAAVGSKDGFSTGGTNKWGSKTIAVSPAKTGKIKIVTIASSSGKYAAIDNISVTYTPGDVTPTPSYSVTYKANYGEVADVVNDAAKKVGACPFEAPEGKKFAGWNSAADGTGTAYEVGAALEADVVLYAQWADVCYEAIYDLVGGIGSAEVTAADATVNEGVSLVMTNSAGRITITPAEGFTFQAGDIIEFAGTVGNASRPFGIKIGSDTYEAAEVIYNNPEVATEGGTASYSGVLKSNAETLVIGRDGGTTTTLNSLVIKRETICREVDHVVETLTSAAINGVALDPNFLSELTETGSVEVFNAYTTAPTVTFTVQTDTYYVGEETPSTKSEGIDVVAELAAGMWQAQYTVGEHTYTIMAAKPATRTITFMDGETVLGTEVVAQGDPSTKHADFEVKPLTEFQGWYLDAALTTPVDAASYSIDADITFYGKFVKTYISANVNIEKLVLDYGTTYDIQSALTAAGWDYANLNSLDTLNDLENKTNRNYDFLGLKLKTAGAYIQGWIPTDGGVVIKFGNLGSDIKVNITGANTNLEQTFTKADLWNEEEQANVLAIWGFPEDVLVKISTVTGSTVVLKQLMLINEGIQVVNLPAPSAYAITLNAGENGTLAADWEGKTDKKVNVPVGALVTLTATPADGYEIDAITVSDVALEAVEGVYSFTMPATEVTVAATFKAAGATALDEAVEAEKAHKVVRDGQIIIIRGDKEFNLVGAEL